MCGNVPYVMECGLQVTQRDNLQCLTSKGGSTFSQLFYKSHQIPIHSDDILLLVWLSCYSMCTLIVGHFLIVFNHYNSSEWNEKPLNWIGCICHAIHKWKISIFLKLFMYIGHIQNPSHVRFPMVDKFWVFS